MVMQFYQEDISLLFILLICSCNASTAPLVAASNVWLCLEINKSLPGTARPISQILFSPVANFSVFNVTLAYSILSNNCASLVTFSVTKSFESNLKLK